MALHPALDHVHARQRAESAAAVLHQLAVAHHRLQALVEAGQLAFGQPQVHAQLGRGQRPGVAAEGLEQEAAARQRVLVLLLLAGVVRIVFFPVLH